MIHVHSFSKQYDSALAVSELSFEVQPGEVLGLVGRNGAGKTTTLKSIAGIIPASGGKLAVNGFDVSTNPLEVKQRSAYVPDDPELFNDLTVEQHLVFAAGIYGIEQPDLEMNRLLDTFELQSKRHAAASELSRGMKQKLAIATALLQNPDALLLDEPMTGLDPQGIRKLKETIRHVASKGTSVIISSHLLAMVEDICTHVMILESGQRKFFGPIEELKARFSDGGESQQMSLEDIYFETMGLLEETTNETATTSESHVETGS